MGEELKSNKIHVNAIRFLKDGPRVRAC